MTTEQIDNKNFNPYRVVICGGDNETRETVMQILHKSLPNSYSIGNTTEYANNLKPERWQHPVKLQAAWEGDVHILAPNTEIILHNETLADKVAEAELEGHPLNGEVKQLGNTNYNLVIRVGETNGTWPRVQQEYSRGGVQIMHMEGKKPEEIAASGIKTILQYANP